MTIIHVVAVVIEREGRYLLGRRPPEKRHGALWEFPGGKTHDGEDHLAAARRELLEELDLEVRAVGRVIYSRQDPGSPFLIEFVKADVSGEPTALEHTEIGWYTPEELSSMPLAPTDAAFVELLMAAP
ncbi:MAG: NUDIX domain-containing protein [Gemmatimonadota bacterium]|nr:NUDIX domain-containing protein [Gemmatimonadota bacterium]